MHKHITVVGALHIAWSVFWIFFGFVVFVAVVGGGLISQDEEAIAITGLVGSTIFSLLVVLSIPGIIGGIGLLKRRHWARILILILSCINLLNIPFGTALGIYSIWVLIQDEAIQELEGSS
jgi:hypothetical protein